MVEIRDWDSLTNLAQLLANGSKERPLSTLNLAHEGNQPLEVKHR